MNDQVADLFEDLDLAVPERLMSELEQAMRGDFELIRPLARGGMGIVFLARDVRLERVVAVKVLQADVFTTKSEIERFKLEARTVAALDHPHIVPVYSVREAEGLFLYIMRYIDGQTLEQLIAEGPVDAARVQTIILMAAMALELAHGRGVVHRDIKPANLIVDATGCTYVMDFGIARVSDGNGLTQAGAFVGTPNYASPEQCQGQSATELSDQYSLGVVAYELLRGKAIFEADSMAGMLQHHMNTPPPDLTLLPVCPPKLAYALERMVAKVPEARWPSMSALIDYLSDTEAGAGIRNTALSLRPVTTSHRTRVGSNSTATVVGEAAGASGAETRAERVGRVSRSRWLVPGTMGLVSLVSAGLIGLAVGQGRSSPVMGEAVESVAPATVVEATGDEDEPAPSAGGASGPAPASALPVDVDGSEAAPAEADAPSERTASGADRQTQAAQPTPNPTAATPTSSTAATPVDPPRDESVEAPSGPGSILLGTRGARAVLYIDGESIGAVARLRTWEVESGTRSLMIRAEGCAPWDTTVVVEPGETLRLGYRMQGCLPLGGGA